MGAREGKLLWIALSRVNGFKSILEKAKRQRCPQLRRMQSHLSLSASGALVMTRSSVELTRYSALEM